MMKISLSLLLCFLVASCSATSIVGGWRCDDSDFVYDLFTSHAGNRNSYYSDGTYLGKFDFTIDYRNIGKVYVTARLQGTWQFDGNVLLETRGLGQAVDFHTTTDIPEEVVAEGLLMQFPTGEIIRSHVKFITKDQVEMFNLDEKPEDKYFCERRAIDHIT